MLVKEQHKSIYLNLKDPQRILDSIPSAQLLHQGANSAAVVVPHDLGSSYALRALGIKAPAPILYYYSWPGRFTPYDHQRSTAAFLTMHRKALVLNEIGTGKTNAALWAADYLMSIGQVKKVLIISPLSTLERVWGDAIFTELIHRKHVTLYGTAAKRLKLLNTDVDFYIVNHEGFTVIYPQLEQHNPFDLVIIDEAAVYRNISSKRFKVMKRFVKANPDMGLWLMTGTPTPNEPTDAFALATLVGNQKCPLSFNRFKDKVMLKVSKWSWVPRATATQQVFEVLQPSIRYERDDCFDLPDTVFQTHGVKLTSDQDKHYKTMLKHLVTEVANTNVITAVNEAVMLGKLMQIACGVMYDDLGRSVQLDCTPRIQALRSIIDNIGGKVIIFAPLTSVIHMLEQELSKTWTVGAITGAVSAANRNKIFHGFQNGADPQILLAHPKTMSHGLTLTAAAAIVWFGPVTSNEVYTQANGRIERIGKKHTSLVIHLESTAVERKVYSRLKDKQKLQGLLLDLINDHSNGVTEQ